MKKKNLIALILTVSTIASVGGMGVSAATTSTLNKATVGSTATTNKKGKVVNVKTNLNVRQSADVKSKSLAKLKNNESVTLISKSGDWYKVKTSKGVTGYVSKAYIKEVSTGSTTTNGGTSIANKKGKVVNVKTNLNVRESASVKSKSLAKLKNNESVTLISRSGDWYKVKTSKGVTGYVSKAYIKEVSTTSTNTNLGTGTIDMKGGVNLRKTADWKGEKVKVIKNGEKVTVLSKSNGWYKVKSGDKTGYVASEYVKLSTNAKA